jgi:hypothetical protein
MRTDCSVTLHYMVVEISILAVAIVFFLKKLITNRFENSRE